MRTADYQHLKQCLQDEVIGAVKPRPFSWFRIVHRALKTPDRRYYFWWRIASYLYQNGGKRQQKIALRIGRKLRNKYGLDISLNAKIGTGMRISHYVGIVITGSSNIGRNMHIRQNVTIGVKYDGQPGDVVIGDNIDIGANCCIIGDGIIIGSNVTIGAMTFVNKSVPDNTIIYNQRESILISKEKPLEIVAV